MGAEPPSLVEIVEAARGLRGVVVHTPLVPFQSPQGSEDLFLKPEIHQPAGSFKIRGVYHAVQSLSAEERARGLSTVSAGNTAQALSWCGRRFGVRARSIMPESAPRTKIEAVERLGGEPVLLPSAEVFRFLRERLWADEPYAFIHPWTHRAVMTGHGSIGVEIVADLPEVETVIVPVGGGGLMGGVATALKALKPTIRVLAVEPEGCPALHESLRRGEPSRVECHTLCDGVAVPFITDEMFPILRRVVDDVLLVSEAEVADAIRLLAVENHLIVEGAGALSVAAAVGARDLPSPVVCLVTGGSIDLDRFTRILTREG